MAEERLTLKAETYYCEPCSEKQGTLVKELVRMIPVSVVIFDKLVGDEYFCCPICFEPKFTVKGRKAVKREKVGKVAGISNRGGAEPSKPAPDRPITGPVLVKG